MYKNSLKGPCCVFEKKKKKKTGDGKNMIIVAVLRVKSEQEVLKNLIKNKKCKKSKVPLPKVRK